MRARENSRADRLFSDPYASLLAVAEDDETRAPTGPEAVREPAPDKDPSLPVRTLYFDTELLRITWAENVRQIVIAGAGMDARAFRLRWPPGTLVVELDQPSLLELKNRIISRIGAQPKCTRVSSGVDLAADWIPELSMTPFSSATPVAWLLEGLLYYLSPQQRDTLLGGLSSLSPTGSWLLLDYIRESEFYSQSGRAWLDEMGNRSSPWLSGCDDPVGLLKFFGWQASVAGQGEPGADYGRWTAARAAGTVSMHGRYLVVASRRRMR